MYVAKPRDNSRKTFWKFLPLLLYLGFSVLLIGLNIGATRAFERQVYKELATHDFETSRIVHTPEEKIALRKACFTENPPEFDHHERENEKQRIYTSLLFGKTDTDTAVAQLKQLGVHALASSVESFRAVALPSTANLRHGTVLIFYDAYLDSWDIGAGIHWISDIPYGFNDDVFFDWLRVGMGVTFSDGFGSYEGCTLKKTWLYVSTGDEVETTVSYSPTWIVDSKYGYYHEFSDNIVFNGLPLFSKPYYYGNYVAVFGRYSAEFENFGSSAEIVYKLTGIK